MLFSKADLFLKKWREKKQDILIVLFMSMDKPLTPSITENTFFGSSCSSITTNIKYKSVVGHAKRPWHGEPTGLDNLKMFPVSKMQSVTMMRTTIKPFLLIAIPKREKNKQTNKNSINSFFFSLFILQPALFAFFFFFFGHQHNRCYLSWWCEIWHADGNHPIKTRRLKTKVKQNIACAWAVQLTGTSVWNVKISLWIVKKKKKKYDMNYLLEWMFNPH